MLFLVIREPMFLKRRQARPNILGKFCLEALRFCLLKQCELSFSLIPLWLAVYSSIYLFLLLSALHFVSCCLLFLEQSPSLCCQILPPLLCSCEPISFSNHSQVVYLTNCLSLVAFLSYICCSGSCFLMWDSTYGKIKECVCHYFVEHCVH